MSNLALVTDNMLPVANETFIDNLSAGISAGAAIVPINSLAEYADGDSVVLTVDPGTASQATFIGEKQGNTVIDCKWTEGNVGASHAAGATVIDYDSATHYNVVTKLLRMFANENGSLKTVAVQAALNISSAVPSDYSPLANAASITASNGQREHVLQFTGADYTDRLGIGTKLRIPRGTAAPTQAIALTSSSSQYASKAAPAGLTQTDDITLEAMVYVPSYGGNDMPIISDSSTTQGWHLSIDPNGRVLISGHNAGATNYRRVTSYQSIPTGKWVHVAAALDMSGFTLTTCKVWIEGVPVPAFLTSTGSNPTSFNTTGATLAIGRYDFAAPVYFNGYVSEARIWNGLRTDAQIRDNAAKPLVGNEAGLLGLFQGNGNFNDKTTNANNLTAINGALSTSPRNPMSDVEFAIVTSKPVFSGGNTTCTIFTGPCLVPNTTLGAVSFSNLRTPYGFPASEDQWGIDIYTTAGYNNGATSGLANLKFAITVPTGKWGLGYNMNAIEGIASAGVMNARFDLQTATNVVDIKSPWCTTGTAVGGTEIYPLLAKEEPIDIAAQTTYNLNGQSVGTNFTTFGVFTAASGKLFAKCKLL